MMLIVKDKDEVEKQVEGVRDEVPVRSFFFFI
jgi:hypothetical protein